MDFDFVEVLMDFDSVEKERPAGPAHPDFGLMSRNPQPLLASHFRSEGLRPLWNPSPP